jgi:hypothetical protein
MFQSSSHRDLVDGFFNGSVNYIEPDCRSFLLTYAVYPGYGLQLNSSVYQGFTQEYVTCVHKVETRRMSFGVQKKALDSRILLKSFDSTWLVYGAKTNPIVGQSTAKDIEKFLELREYDGLCTRVLNFLH